MSPFFDDVISKMATIRHGQFMAAIFKMTSFKKGLVKRFFSSSKLDKGTTPVSKALKSQMGIFY